MSDRQRKIAVKARRRKQKLLAAAEAFPLPPGFSSAAQLADLGHRLEIAIQIDVECAATGYRNGIAIWLGRKAKRKEHVVALAYARLLDCPARHRGMGLRALALRLSDPKCRGCSGG